MQNLLLKNNPGFLKHVITILGDRLGQQQEFFDPEVDWGTIAGVLMLFGQKPGSNKSGAEPCLVLNKRSLKVRQPGDLCFPGGSMTPHIDPYLALTAIYLAGALALLGRLEKKSFRAG